MEKYEPYREGTKMEYNGIHCCYGTTNGLVDRERHWDYEKNEFYVLVPIKGSLTKYERRYEKKK